MKHDLFILLLQFASFFNFKLKIIWKLGWVMHVGTGLVLLLALILNTENFSFNCVEISYRVNNDVLATKDNIVQGMVQPKLKCTKEWEYHKEGVAQKPNHICSKWFQGQGQGHFSSLKQVWIWC